MQQVHHDSAANPVSRHRSCSENLDNQHRKQEEQENHAEKGVQDAQAPCLMDMFHPGEGETGHRQDDDEEPHPSLPESGHDPGHNDEGE